MVNRCGPRAGSVTSADPAPIQRRRLPTVTAAYYGEMTNRARAVLPRRPENIPIRSRGSRGDKRQDRAAQALACRTWSRIRAGKAVQPDRLNQAARLLRLA